MKLRTKLTLTLLFVSLVSAAMVGGIAYWLLMRNYRQSVMDRAFRNFQTDVSGYLRAYGTWQQGQRYESFPHFVQRTRRPFPFRPRPFGPPPPPRLGPGGTPLGRHGQAPFLFMLLAPSGRVIKAGGSYHAGQMASPRLRREARPIKVNGKVAVLAVPLGDPNFTPRDLVYLDAMRRALVIGFLGAGTLAVLLGLLFGRRMSASLVTMTTAVRAMRTGGGLEQQVPVRSRDELGELAAAFNTMSAELSEAHHELYELSIRDPLTQLYNRRHFNEHAERLFEQAERYDHPLTVMVGDLDHFKRINDTYSHAVGDEVLRRIGKILAEHTRKSDVLARHGGEEFVIAFAETTMAQAAQRCERLRREIEAHPWDEVHEGLHVTMSMGLSDDRSLRNVERMLCEADARLYAAKEDGRNRVETVRKVVGGAA